MSGEKSNFIVKFYDKAYEDKTILKLLDVPVDAISGVTEAVAVDLKEALDVCTVEDLASNEYVLIAQAIVLFSDASGAVLDKEFESKEFEDLADKPVHAIAGISESDGALLKKSLGIDTIRELADNKYVLVAQATVTLATLVEFLIDEVF